MDFLRQLHRPFSLWMHTWQTLVAWLFKWQTPQQRWCSDTEWYINSRKHLATYACHVASREVASKARPHPALEEMKVLGFSFTLLIPWSYIIFSVIVQLCNIWAFLLSMNKKRRKKSKTFKLSSEEETDHSREQIIPLIVCNYLYIYIFLVCIYICEGVCVYLYSVYIIALLWGLN